MLIQRTIRIGRSLWNWDPARLKFALVFIREPQRWSIAALAVVLGTIGLILADGFIERIFRDMREGVVRSHFGHVQVLPVEDAQRSNGIDVELAALRPDVERALQDFPGTVVAARLSLVALASHGERTISVIAEGVEPHNERTSSSELVITKGKQLEDDDSARVLVGEGLARNLGLDVGGVITLLATTRGGGVNAVELEVSGLFFTTTKAYDDRALRLPLATAQRLVRAQGISRLVVVLRDTPAAPAAAGRLKATLAGAPVVVKVWTEVAEFYNKTVTLLSSQLAAVRAVIAAIVLLSVSNTMARNVMERTSEIGTMMALGWRRTGVARTFLGEGVMIGLVGGSVGVLAGWALATAISFVGIPMPPPPGMARGFMAGVAFSGSIGATAFAIAVATATVATLLPALRASRMNVVDALREGR